MSVELIGDPFFAPLLSTCWKKVPEKVPAQPMAMNGQLGFEASSQVTSALEASKAAICAFEVSAEPWVIQLTWSSPEAAPITLMACGPFSVFLSLNVAMVTFRATVLFAACVYFPPRHVS